MRLCNATTKAGEACQRPAQAGSPYCIGHDPTKASLRSRMASRGGRGRTSSETRAVKKLMDDLAEKALAGDLLPPVVHAVVALQNIKLRAIEQERKLKELEDVLLRLDALEEKQRRAQGNRTK